MLAADEYVLGLCSPSSYKASADTLKLTSGSRLCIQRLNEHCSPKQKAPPAKALGPPGCDMASSTTPSVVIADPLTADSRGPVQSSSGPHTAGAKLTANTPTCELHARLMASLASRKASMWPGAAPHALMFAGVCAPCRSASASTPGGCMRRLHRKPCVGMQDHQYAAELPTRKPIFLYDCDMNGRHLVGAAVHMHSCPAA
jgi:hypothetical protein